MSTNTDETLETLVCIEFDINGITIIGTYHNKTGWLIGKTEDLLDQLLPEDLREFAPLLPKLDITTAHKRNTNNYVFSAEVSPEIDFSNIPLVGEALPSNQNCPIKRLRVIASNIEPRLRIQSDVSFFGFEQTLEIPINTKKSVAGTS